MRRAAAVPVLALLLSALLPSEAWAWSPGTHVFLGEAVLVNLPLLPAAVADLVRAFPSDFLYGSIAADTSFAKKYAPVGRNSHTWHVGQEILDLAGSDPLRALGLGYLAHLAADVIAHNFFVPRQLVMTSSTRALGHSYWEARFDMHLGEAYARQAREIIGRDHTASDQHLDRILSPTIFSVRTNRRLFRGMVQLVDSDSWQRVVQLAAQRSRWDLTDRDVERHVAASFDFIMDLLIAGEAARARRFDPSGAAAIAAAKRMRRLALASGGRRDSERVSDVAEEHFGVPHVGLGYWDRYDFEPCWRRPTTRSRRRSRQVRS